MVFAATAAAVVVSSTVVIAAQSQHTTYFSITVVNRQIWISDEYLLAGLFLAALQYTTVVQFQSEFAL